MSLQSLQKYLVSIVSQGNLSLLPTDTKLPQGLRNFLNASPVQKINLQLDPGIGIRLDGATLLVEGKNAEKWPVQNMRFVAFTVEMISLVITQPSPQKTEVRLKATGRLPFSKNQLVAARLDSPTSATNPWRITLAEDAQGISPQTAVLLGTAGTMPWRLPSSVSFFTPPATLAASDFAIGFHPHSSSAFSYRFRAAFPQIQWEVIPDMLQLSNPSFAADFAANSLGVNVEGKVKIGSLEMVAGLTFSGQQQWLGYIRPATGDRFPGITALAAVFAKELKIDEGFQGLTFDREKFDLALRAVSLSFDPFERKLLYARIDSVLTLQGIDFLLSLSIPDFRFQGHLSRNTPIQVREWLSRIGLDISAIPETLTVTQLELEAAPLDKYYQIAGRITQVWQVGNFKIEEIGLVVSYDGAGENPVYAGQFDCKTSYFGLDFRLSVGYETDQGWVFWGRAFTEKPLNIGQWISQLEKDNGNAKVPELLKSLTLKDVAVGYETKDGAFSFGCFGGFKIADADCEAEFALRIVPGKSFTLGGWLRIDLAEFAASLEVGTQTKLKLHAEDVDLKYLLKRLLPEVDLPPQLPDLFLEFATVVYNHSTGEFSLEAKAVVDWENPLGFEGEMETTFTIKGSRGPVAKRNRNRKSNRTVTLGIGFALKGPIKLSDGLTLESLGLSFDYESGKSWVIKGDIGGKVLESPLKLGAEFTGEGKDRSILLKAEIGADGKELLSLPGIASLKAAAFSLKLSRKGEKWEWNVEAKSSLRLMEMVTLSGSLFFERKDGVTSLRLKGDEGSMIKLLLMGKGILDNDLYLEVSAPMLAFKLDNSQRWIVWTSADLALTGLPSKLYELGIVPRSTTITLAAGSEGVSFTASSVTGPFDFDLPDFKFFDLEIPLSRLGKCRVEVRNLQLKLSKDYALTVELWLGLPSRLNYILFGEAPGGKPGMELFKVYDPQVGDESMVKLKFGFGKVFKDQPLGLIFELVNSPIQPLKVENGVWKCDLGDFGAADIALPKFSLSTGGFSGKVGYKVTRPMRIPLMPIKRFLERAGMTAAAKLLPPYWPLMEMEFFENGRLKTREVIAFLDQVSREMQMGPLPESIAKVIDTIGEIASKFPDDFKEYLQFSVPTEFELVVSITSDGGFNIRVDLGESKPIRLLIPSLAGGLPCLQGVTLHGFSFGTILAGSLFTLSAKVKLDLFDLPSLVASVAIPDNDLLPPSKSIRRRIVIDDLFVLIVYQTYFPIPLPIFYEELAIESLGPEGLALQAHISFPTPKLDLLKLLKRLISLRQFVVDPNHFLPESDDLATVERIDPTLGWGHPDSADSVWAQLGDLSGLDLTLDVWDVYLELPKWAGAAVIGKKGTIIEESLWRRMAQLLNAMKSMSLARAIALIPIEVRANKAEIQLWFLKLEAKWLLTTPEEFSSSSFTHLGIESGEVDKYKLLLPENGKVPGLVAFLNAKTLLGGGDWGSLDVSMGMIHLGAKAVTAHIRIEGFIKNVIRLRLFGEVLYVKEPIQFQLKGDAFLEFAGFQIFKSSGLLLVKQDLFYIEGQFELFKGLPFEMFGGLKGHVDPNGLSFEGGITAKFGPVVLASASAMVYASKTQQRLGVFIKGQFLGATLDFALTDEPSQFRILLDFQAGTVATVKGFITLNKTNKTMHVDFSANAVGFGEFKALSSPNGDTTNYTVTQAGLQLASGVITSTPEQMNLVGTLRLLPSDSPVNLVGSVTGHFSGSNVQLHAAVSVCSFLPGVLVTGELWLTKANGLQASVTFLGLPLGLVRIQITNSTVSLTVTANLAFVVTNSLSIGTNGSGGTNTLSGGIGDLVLSGTTGLGASASGGFSLTLLSMTLLSGDISLSGDRFSLGAKMDFVILIVNLGGSISSAGVVLGGSGKFSIWVIVEISLELHFEINNGLPKMRLVALGNTLNMAIRVYRGVIAYLSDFWIGPAHIYLAVSTRGVQVDLGRPGDWPPDLQSSPMPEGIEELAEMEDANLLTPLELVGPWLFRDWKAGEGSSMVPDDGGKSWLPSAELYRMGAHVTRDQASAGQDLIVQVTISRTSRGRDFFSDLGERIDRVFAGLSMSNDEVSSRRISEFIDMKTVEATFMAIHGTQDHGQAKLLLRYLSPSGQPGSLLTVYNFSQPHHAIDHLARQLIKNQ